MSKQSKRARFAVHARRRRQERRWLSDAGIALCDHLGVPRGTLRFRVASTVWRIPPRNASVRLSDPPMNRMDLRDHWERQWLEVVAAKYGKFPQFNAPSESMDRTPDLSLKSEQKSLHAVCSRAGANLDDNRAPKAAAELKPVFKELSGKGTR